MEMLLVNRTVKLKKRKRRIDMFVELYLFFNCDGIVVNVLRIKIQLCESN